MPSKICPRQLSSAIRIGLVIVMGASVSPAAAHENATSDVPDWIRGRGERLELQLTGQVTRGDGGSVDGAEVRIDIKYDDRVRESLKPPVDDRRFQVWLPVNASLWHSITVNATCRDGARCTRTILRRQLREVVVDGLILNVQLPDRQVAIRVEHDGVGVANAKVRAQLSNGDALRLETNANGSAQLTLLAREELTQLTAWSQEPLIGGYQFARTPVRHPRADSHVISMHRCRPLEVHLKDTNGRPIGGTDLRLQVATPAPDYNHLGMPDDYQPTTDQYGIATFAWYPDMEGAHCYAEMLDNRWVVLSSQRGKDKLDVVAKRAVKRKRITGRVLGGGRFAGGFSVKFGSFEAEQEGRIDYVHSFSDADGHFSADVLPDATYALVLEDKECVANAVDLVPFDSRTEKQQAVELRLSEGIPVRIVLTQGGDRKPLSGVWVNIDSVHRFTWLADGEPRSGSLGSCASDYANDHGVLEILAPEGELKATVSLSDWRATENINVRRGARNVLTLHRKVDRAVEVAGKIIPWKADQEQVAGATVHVKAIDGETGDEFRFKADADGGFRFKTKATKVVAIAHSPDKRFVGTLAIKDLSQPARIELQPAKSFSGRITDQDGNPVVNHVVWASIGIEDGREGGTAEPTTFYVQRIETQTDPDGNYRLDGLPCQSRIRLATNTLDNEPNRFELVDVVFFLPDDDVRSRVTRIGKSPSRDPQLSLAQRFAAMHRDCRLGSYHLMVIVHDKSKVSNVEFINRRLLNDAEQNAVRSYMQLQVDVHELAADGNLAFIERLDWPKAIQGVFTCVYDSEGRELGRGHIDPAASDAADTANEFIERNVPTRQDAEAKWSKAFQQAKEQDKHVWARTGQRYCGPCLMLSRWIDDHREMLEKDFVLLRIDDDRDLNGQAIAARLTRGRSVGVPFHAIFDANERVLVDSYGPLGNVGFMSGLEGKRHFKKMLETACTKITPQEIQVLLDSLKD